MAGEKILIIEDEQDVAAMVEIMLRENDYRTIIAYDGLLAWTWLCKKSRI